MIVVKYFFLAQVNFRGPWENTLNINVALVIAN